MKPKLTVDGHNQLQTRLSKLRDEKTDARERIRTARKFCDFREDVTYAEAVDHYEQIETDILEIERVLDDAVIIESEQSKIVTFGNKVVIREVGEDETENYRIVGEAEANIENGTISITSPLGRELIGAEAGQIVQIESPGGALQFEVLQIEA
ncbi:MAG: GreA/GreB family elongation factor [Exiguobacterium marinum]|uniref:GreA/GreB family elongation factor n=1 Tax=Exiguobacterium marinum TaxID=273528 RepID=UPI003C344776